MAEQLNSKRAIFSHGKQKKFLLQAKGELCVTWKELAEISETSVRNLGDWRNEKFSMSFVAVKSICKKRKCKLPKGITIKDAYWYVTKGAVAGGKALVEKYGIVGGNQEYRKQKWREWWEKEGKLKPSKITQPLPFKKPKFSKELAEFIGILLGDGGISEHQITVTLHRVTDRKYSLFVRKLIKKLFGIKAGEYRDKQFLADSIVISRTGLVRYCVEKLGLKKGNKVRQQVRVPEWIEKNAQFREACVRGLVDTDGGVYTHSYISKGKRYNYKKLQFVSLSKPLADFVYTVLRDIGSNPRIYKEKDVRLESISGVKRYFELIGSHNEKHRRRYKWLK